MLNMCKLVGNIAKGEGGPVYRVGVEFESIFNKKFFFEN
jgi:hypothetical protein